jgi:hypothetical protein
MISISGGSEGQFPLHRFYLWTTAVSQRVKFFPNSMTKGFLQPR